MFTVIQYFNYRKDMTMSIHKIFSSKENAMLYAKKLAIDRFGTTDISVYIQDNHLNIKNCVAYYTSKESDGYDCDVYCVVYMNLEIDDGTMEVSKWKSEEGLSLTDHYLVEGTFKNTNIITNYTIDKPYYTVDKAFENTVVCTAKKNGLNIYGLEYTDVTNETFVGYTSINANDTGILEKWLWSLPNILSIKISEIDSD